MKNRKTQKEGLIVMMKMFFSILGCILTLVAFASFGVVAANGMQVETREQTKTVTVSESSNYTAKVANAYAVEDTMTTGAAPAETTVTIGAAPETMGTTQTTAVTDNFVISGITAPDETTTTRNETDFVISGITGSGSTTTETTTTTTVQTERDKIIPISGVVGDPCDLYHDKDGDGAITVYDLCLAKRNRDRDAYLIQDFLLVRNTVKATKTVNDVKNIQISEQSNKILENMYMNADTVKFVEANGKRFLRFETGYYHDDTHGEADLFFEQLTADEYSKMELQLSFYLNNVGNGSYHAYVYADADNGCYAIDVQYTNN